jgi:hypothetical protein
LREGYEQLLAGACIETQKTLSKGFQMKKLPIFIVSAILYAVAIISISVVKNVYTITFTIVVSVLFLLVCLAPVIKDIKEDSKRRK